MFVLIFEGFLIGMETILNDSYNITSVQAWRQKRSGWKYWLAMLVTETADIYGVNIV